uniref:F-box domain-containing protein n=1 Tax=Panagrolaimus sp. PS1159 TaxID=55785 RepID=A0AC35FKK0_9BILA
MDSSKIEFYSLPLLVQQEISDLIVSSFLPSEAVNFGILSRHCFTLFQRSKPRKELSNLSITFNNDLKCEIYGNEFSKPKEMDSAKSIIEFLNQICITDSVNINWNQAINLSFFSEIWFELSAAMKFVRSVSISTVAFDETSSKLLVEFFSRLPNCGILKCVGRQTTFKHPIFEIINVLQKHSHLTFMRSNEANDEFLETLAEKTSVKNPLESLCIFSNSNFTVEGVTQFLQKAAFGKTAKIALTPIIGAANEYINAFKNLGAVEFNRNRNAVAIKMPETTIIFAFSADIQIPENPNNLSFDFRPIFTRLGRMLPSLRST